MSNAVFPAEVRGYDVLTGKSADFDTIVQSAPSGSTFRLGQMRNPMWTFSLTYNYIKDRPNDIAPGLTYTDLQTLMGFYLARGGQFDSFLYDDPDDHFVGPALLPPPAPASTPNPKAELQVVSSGGTYYSPVQRNMGGQFWEDITDLNGPIAVYADGVLKHAGTDYNLLGPGLALPGNSFIGLYLEWLGGAPAAPVTAEFFFYFRVRFTADHQTFERFLQELWTIGGPDAKQSSSLEFVTARPPTS